MNTNPIQSFHNSSFRLITSAAVAGLLFCVAPLSAQSNPPSAPLPAAVINAQKIFLGNAGETDNDDCLRAYNDFYAGLKTDGHFQLVTDPAQADLVLELHYEIRPGGLTGSSSAVNTEFARQFRLVMFDPHTRTVLWSLTRQENNAVLQSNRNKNLDEAVSLLLADFKSLHNGTYATTVPAPTKTRLSDQGSK